MRLTLLPVLTLVTACAGSTSPPTAAPPTHRPTALPSSALPSAGAQPAGPCDKALGGTVKLADPASGRRLDITLSSASRSQRALADYGQPPSSGYYVTVQARIVNRGTGPAAIDPLDFLADAGGRTGVDVHAGNAPYSGAPGQLGATPVDVGETITGPLTFDLSAAHGRVRYAPKGHTACAWSF
ncbi:MAG: DUF4352 domain-containing protein [Actinomycetota bacterium]|nr:DUF4352 domain-containing protein [Actinomycetota bacterium]